MVSMHSGGTQFIASAILAAMVALPLCAAYTDGEFIAEGALDGTFAINSADASPFVASTSAAVAALPPVGYCMGETVDATAQGGAVSALVSVSDSVLSGGSVAFSPGAGGSWTLTNSSGESAVVIIPWSIYGDWDGLLAATDGDWVTFTVDSLLPGPVRKVRDGVYPSVAYTGDNWVGDTSNVATLTITSPSGVVTVLDDDDLNGGNGATAFKFSGAGKWTVVLAMTDGTTETATIRVSGGFIISFH